MCRYIQGLNSLGGQLEKKSISLVNRVDWINKLNEIIEK